MVRIVGAGAEASGTSARRAVCNRAQTPAPRELHDRPTTQVRGGLSHSDRRGVGSGGGEGAEGRALRQAHVYQDLRRNDAAAGLHAPGLALYGRSIGLSGSDALHPRRPGGNRVEDWDVRQIYAYPDPAECNGIILNELARGVTSLHLRFDRAARAGLDADHPDAGALAGADGTMIYSVDDLDRLLTGAYLDLVTVSLGAGAQAVAAAAMLEALWHRRRLDRNAAKGAFNADPLGALAATGALPMAIDAALAQTADLARHVTATYPHVTAVGVDTS